jgi:hypothetical protein
MFEGQLFTIYTDHKLLTYALGKVADGWTAMQCRQLSNVAEFMTDIRHMPGVDNVVANKVCWPPSHTAGPDSCQPALDDQPALYIAAVSPSLELLDSVSIAKNQLTCPSNRKAETSSSLQLLHINVQGHQLLCDMSRGGHLPLIPEVDRKRGFPGFLGLFHLGTCAYT